MECGEGRNGGRWRRRRREREEKGSRGLAEEINNGLGNPRSVVHTGGKLPTIPDNGEKEERGGAVAVGNHLPRSVQPFFSAFTFFFFFFFFFASFFPSPLPTLFSLLASNNHEH